MSDAHIATEYGAESAPATPPARFLRQILPGPMPPPVAFLPVMSATLIWIARP
jgi:hypothetical protein